MGSVGVELLGVWDYFAPNDPKRTAGFKYSQFLFLGLSENTGAWFCRCCHNFAHFVYAGLASVGVNLTSSLASVK